MTKNRIKEAAKRVTIWQSRYDAQRQQIEESDTL